VGGPARSGKPDLLDAFACRDLGDERASQEAAEQALNLAEPDRLILPFAMTGAWQLLETVPRHGTSHAALITDILDAVWVLDAAGQP
jgi:LuxR family transcriptional regulator, maltose regulon positive regulatory protein